MIMTDDELISARLRFREALMMSREARRDIGEVEAAAARFCRALQRTGHTREATLIDAKRVIEEATGGENAPVAERAIMSCIHHYYAT
jgi:hypothetical protein